MKNRTLLFVMSDQTPDSELQELMDPALEQGARLVCLLLTQAPNYPFSAYGALPYGGLDAPAQWVDDLNAAHERLKVRADAIEAMLQKQSVAGEVHPVACVPLDVREIVARRAMVCDAATVSNSLRDQEPDLFFPAVHGLLFDSPIGLTLNAPALAAPEHVFLAWNTELSAARAAHVALPLLKAAKEVVIGVIDPQAYESEDGENPGSQLAKWLSHHDIKVTVNQYPSGGHDIGTAIQSRARELGADLVVMGAYGHSRMRQIAFGGVTLSMLKQTDTPVFLAH